jgi:hypothetical protein
MTEAEWLTGEHAVPMLEFLLGRATDRKLRLFACACCRCPPVSRFLTSRHGHDLIDTVERWVDGNLPREEVVRCAADSPRGRVSGGPCRSMKPVRLPPSSQAERAALALASEDAFEAAWEVVRQGINLLGSIPCDLLRDIFGNPFRPATIDPIWLARNDRAVLLLAQAIYDERAFDRLPILADALEDAGCTSTEILAHCRSGGEHVRGCWVVDALTR